MKSSFLTIIKPMSSSALICGSLIPWYDWIDWIDYIDCNWLWKKVNQTVLDKIRYMYHADDHRVTKIDKLKQPRFV